MEVEAVDVELEDVGAAGDAGGEEGGREGAGGDGGLALGDAGPGQIGVEEGQEVGAVLDDEAVGAGDEEGVERVDGAAVVGAEVDEVEVGWTRLSGGPGRVRRARRMGVRSRPSPPDASGTRVTSACPRPKKAQKSCGWGGGLAASSLGGKEEEGASNRPSAMASALGGVRLRSDTLLRLRNRIQGQL